MILLHPSRLARLGLLRKVELYELQTNSMSKKYWNISSKRYGKRGNHAEKSANNGLFHLKM